jgi:hypothetical protein
LFGCAQVTHVPDVQQIEAAIGERDGVTGPAPFRHLLLQFFASKNLVCDRLCPGHRPRKLWEA